MKTLDLTPDELAIRNDKIGKDMSAFMQAIGGITQYIGAEGAPGSTLKFEIKLPKLLKFLGWMPNCAPCTSIVLTEEKDHWLIKGENNIEDLDILRQQKSIPKDAPLIQTEVIKGFHLVIDTDIESIIIGPDETGKITNHPLYRYLMFEVKHLIKI